MVSNQIRSFEITCSDDKKDENKKEGTQAKTKKRAEIRQRRTKGDFLRRRQRLWGNPGPGSKEESRGMWIATKYRLIQTPALPVRSRWLEFRRVWFESCLQFPE